MHTIVEMTVTRLTILAIIALSAVSLVTSKNVPNKVSEIRGIDLNVAVRHSSVKQCYHESWWCFWGNHFAWRHGCRECVKCSPLATSPFSILGTGNSAY